MFLWEHASERFAALNAGVPVCHVVFSRADGRQLHNLRRAADRTLVRDTAAISHVTQNPHHITDTDTDTETETETETTDSETARQRAKDKDMEKDLDAANGPLVAVVELDGVVEAALVVVLLALRDRQERLYLHALVSSAELVSEEEGGRGREEEGRREGGGGAGEREREGKERERRGNEWAPRDKDEDKMVGGDRTGGDRKEGRRGTWKARIMRELPSC
eukprot:19524-Rhodomonas_salina.3